MANRPNAQRRGGFIMMLTLVAVALAGLIMVETAPDFSNYAVLAKGVEFDSSLSNLRQVVSAHPFCVTTADRINPSPTLKTTGVVTSDDLLRCLQQFTVPGGSTVASSRVFITTVPRDAYVPARDWLSNKPQSKFWAASYNCVRNPSFFSGSREEAYLDSAFQIYFLRNHTSGTLSQRLWRTDRFGYAPEQVCYLGSQTTIKDCALSEDGSAIAFSSNLYDAALTCFNVFVVGTAYLNPREVTDSRKQTPVVHALSYTQPAWSADGARLAYVQETLAGGRKDLIVSGPLKHDMATPLAQGALTLTTGVGFTCNYIGGLAWSPAAQEASWVGRSRYLAFEYVTGGSAHLGLFDVKESRHVIPFDAAHYPVFYDGGAVPNEQLRVVRPAWLSSGSKIDLAYVYADMNRSVWLLQSPDRYPFVLGHDDTGIQHVRKMFALPADQSLDDRQNDLLFERSTDSRLARSPLLWSGVGPHPVNPFMDVPFVSAGTLAVSPRGTTASFVSQAAPTQVWSSGTDGSRPRLVHTAAETVREVFVSKLDRPWVGTAETEASALFSTAKVVTPKGPARGYFDANGWRRFIGDNQDFPGDYKFPSAWLRLEPPENQNQLLFDDGETIWRVALANPKVLPDINTQTFQGKIDPTWSWQGGTYVSKKARTSIPGDEPADLFKQAFKSATTVILGAGYSPDISPRDDVLCYSGRTGPVTTYPPDATTSPIDNMDLWIGNTGGAPEPPPFDITPDTPDTVDTEPNFSPDGRYIYYQREQQFYSPFLASHASSICRITPLGGVNTIVQECGMPIAEWSGGAWRSQLEFYHVSTSPDGTHVAFVAKERLLSCLGAPNLPTPTLGVDNYREGDVITECVYVKDVLFRSEPVLLLRCITSEPRFKTVASCWPLPYRPPTGGGTPTHLEDYSITALTWTPDGEELLATVSTPMNVKFPKRLNERPSTEEGLADTKYYDMAETQMVLAIPCSISHFAPGVNARELSGGTLDPPGDNYRILVRSAPAAPLTTATDPLVPNWDVNSRRKIFNTVHSRGAACFQRVLTDSAFMDARGFALDAWYVLSGYCRTSMAVEDLHAAQLMVQLLNNKGTLVALCPEADGKIYQIGYPDIGGTEWTRFSAAVKFSATPSQPLSRDSAPYYVNIVLQSLGNHGSFAEFTGLKLERAFEDQDKRPTRFSPGWILFSSSLDSDPRAPGFMMYER